MDIYFAAPVSKLHKGMKKFGLKHLLYSYFTQKNCIIRALADYSWDWKIFVDCGAFTAWRTGEVIDIDDYLRFINHYGHRFEKIAALDAIPGRSAMDGYKRKFFPLTNEDVIKAADETRSNFLYMWERINPDYRHKLVYTYHIGEPIEYLQQMLDDPELNLSSIAVGGAVGRDMPEVEKYLEIIYTLLSNYDRKIHVHGFGIIRKELMKRFSLDSVDSTLGTVSRAMGCIWTPYGVIKVSNKSKHLSNYIDYQPAQVKEYVLQLCEKYDITYEQLQNNDLRELFNFFSIHDHFKSLTAEKPEFVNRNQPLF